MIKLAILSKGEDRVTIDPIFMFTVILGSFEVSSFVAHES